MSKLTPLLLLLVVVVVVVVVKKEFKKLGRCFVQGFVILG